MSTALLTRHSALAPRDYQLEALAAVKSSWSRQLDRPVTGHPAVVLPTGMGKTVIFAHLVKHIVEELDGLPMVLVHRDELANQAAQKIKGVAPGITVGIVKAEKNEVLRQALVASVQTLASLKRRNQLPRVTHIIIDECHHAVAPTYRAILDHFPAAKVVGFTATMGRGDRKGLGDVWSEAVYTRDILYGIKHGYLTDVIGKTVTVPELDLSDVATSRGDYQEEALAEALEEAEAGSFIAKAYLEHCPDRQGVLFAPNVRTAFAFADDLNKAGLVTEVVTGETPVEERAAIYRRYESGQTQILSNCMVLTEGWDAPHASVAIIARPTSSVPLYIQMVGRVLRPHPGKGVALVLDVVGVASRMALASVIDLSPSKVKPEPGETLAEAEERYEEELIGRKVKRGRSAHGLALEEIDLFHRSASAWLRTEAGAWFIPTRDRYFLLWPEDAESWKIGTVPARSSSGLKREVLKTGLDFETAQAWAEQLAGELDLSVSSRKASWRKRKAAPTSAQQSMAESLGIPWEGMTKSQLSDAISVKLLSRAVPQPYPTFN